MPKLTASWTYDANNQLLQVCNATPTNVISQYDYTYDAAGRPHSTLRTLHFTISTTATRTCARWLLQIANAKAAMIMRHSEQSVGNVAELGTEQLVGADVLIGPQRRTNVHHVVQAFRRDGDIPPCDRPSPCDKTKTFAEAVTRDACPLSTKIARSGRDARPARPQRLGFAINDDAAL